MKSIIGAFGVAVFLASALSAQAPGQPAGQGRGGRGQPPDPRSAGGGQCAREPVQLRRHAESADGRPTRSGSKR